MEILYILIPSVAIPLAIALLFFFICACRNNQKSSRPPAPRQPKPVRGQNVEMSMLTTAYKPKVGSRAPPPPSVLAPLRPCPTSPMSSWSSFSSCTSRSCSDIPYPPIKEVEGTTFPPGRQRRLI